MEELIGLFSGGKDSLVACLVAGVKEIVYCRTYVGVNEDYVEEICNLFGWKKNTVKPLKNEYEMFVERYGFPKPTSHTWIMQRLKLNPIKKWHANQKKKKRDIIFVSGIRLDESDRREMNFGNDKEIEESDGLKFYKPILEWTDIQVEDYIKKNHLQISPVYETLGLGGDCLCGAFTKRQHAYLLDELYPNLAKKIKKLEKTCRGHWGQFQPLSACQNQTKITNFVCNECIVKPEMRTKLTLDK